MQIHPSTHTHTHTHTHTTDVMTNFVELNDNFVRVLSDSKIITAKSSLEFPYLHGYLFYDALYRTKDPLEKIIYGSFEDGKKKSVDLR